MTESPVTITLQWSERGRGVARMDSVSVALAVCPSIPGLPHLGEIDYRPQAGLQRIRFKGSELRDMTDGEVAITKVALAKMAWSAREPFRPLQFPPITGSGA